MSVMIGRQYGQLTVLAYIGSRKYGTKGRSRYLYRCQCNCPDKTITLVWGDLLRSGLTKSCGCLRRNLGRERYKMAHEARAKLVQSRDDERRANEPRHPSGLLNPCGYPDDQPVKIGHIRSCEECGRKFTNAGKHGKVYCSETCGMIVKRRRALRYRKERDERRLSAMASVAATGR